jgi:hypothetical protein
MTRLDDWETPKDDAWSCFRSPFYQRMFKLGLSEAQVRGVAAFVSEIFECEACKGECGCADHAVDLEGRDSVDKAYVKVPLLSKNGAPMIHGYFFPLITVLRLLLQEPKVVDSLLFDVDDRVPFTSGESFRGTLLGLSSVHASPPLMVSLFTDAATVVRVGKRSLWAVYMRLLNTSLTPSSTARFVGLVPALQADAFPGMSEDNLRLLRLATYQSMMAAMCHSGFLYADQSELRVNTCQGEHTYRVCLQMFQADSKDHTKASGLLDKTCPRCEGDGKVVLFAERSAHFGETAERVFCAVAEAEAERAAKKPRKGAKKQDKTRVALQKTLNKEDRTHMVRNFSVGLTCFDLAYNSAICILHLNDVGWTKKMLKWTGAVLATMKEPEGNGRKSRIHEVRAWRWILCGLLTDCSSIRMLGAVAQFKATSTRRQAG